MDLQQAKTLLDKINSLYKSISTDGSQIASIERDLMLSYIRQLYESFLETPGGNARSVASVSANSGNSKASQPIDLPVDPPAPEPVKRTYTPPKIIEIPDKPAAPKMEKPAPAPAPEPAPVKLEVQEPAPAPRQQTPVAPAPKPKPAETAVVDAPPAIKALFQRQAATELSEKLSEQPVRDLTKSMAINDRLLYVNDLFGKDNNAFNDALQTLNRLDSMDEATPLLTGWAKQHNWADDEKSDTAKAFIKLVRRRYI
ncbi:MAG: hypothetical protein H6562_16350 [Lewinellaceae bacterium]|nr:hypothetical protein [Lewinellaceae bacterium]